MRTGRIARHWRHAAAAGFRRRSACPACTRCCGGAYAAAGRTRASAVPRPATPRCANPSRCPSAPPASRIVAQRKQAVAEVRFGGRADRHRRAAAAMPCTSAIVKMRGMHQRPARVDLGVSSSQRPGARRARRCNPRPRRSARRVDVDAASSAGNASSTARIASGGTARRLCSAQPTRSVSASCSRSARTGAGRRRHRGRSGAGAPTARGRRSRRACTAPAAGSGGCRFRARPRSARATSRRGSAYGVPSGAWCR